jgi:hypothetical protein
MAAAVPSDSPKPHVPVEVSKELALPDFSDELVGPWTTSIVRCT